jgi:hypothetical protein
MGWDSQSLPLMGNGRGDEFPAFLTFRAGIDKMLMDLMRPEFDKGVRPEAFSGKVLELHSKEYTRSWLHYEQDHAVEIQMQQSNGTNQFERR